MDEYPFILFLPTVILTAALFGGGAGLFASALSSAAAALFLEATAKDATALGLFFLVALVTALMVEALHAAIAEGHHQQVRLEEALLAAEESEAEKALLLRELAHRVMNDLGAVSGLLHQEGRATPECEAGLQRAADRVRVLSRLYRRLNETRGEVTVDTDAFLGQLVQDVDAAHLRDRGIHLTAEIEKHSLTIARAGPLGLVLNEAIMNALKHAFPARSGRIKVGFRRQIDAFELTVRDDGGGPPPGPARVGQGSTLLDALTQQLHGRFRREPVDHGTLCILTFPAENTRRIPLTAIQTDVAAAG